MVLRAGLYVRISEDPEGTREGVRRQETDCRELAKRHGWKVIDVYDDNDVSAWKGKRRPQYERMLDDVTAGRLDVVVAYHLDRLQRHPRDLERFVDVCDRAGISAKTVHGDFDFGNDDALLSARILTAVAKKESDDKSRRLRRQRLETARKGDPHSGGKRAFGYDAGGAKLRKAEARALKEAAARVLRGESVRGIVKDWNARGVRTAGGQRWRAQNLGRTLVNPRYAGLRTHLGTVTADASWPAILERDEHERLVAILRDPARRSGKPVRRYLLAKFLRCGKCGAALISRPRQGGRRSYVCPPVADGGCGGIRREAEALEAFVVAATVQAVESPKFARSIREQAKPDDERAALARELDKLEQGLERLEREYAVEGMWTKAKFLKLRGELDERVLNLRRALAKSEGDRLLAGFPRSEFREWWNSASFEQKRIALSAVLDHVVVRPTRKGVRAFDASAIELVWRV